MLKKIIKYIKHNKKYLINNNVIHKMNGLVLTKTCDIGFELEDVLVKEVNRYCENLNYKIDKIIFISFFDTNDINKPKTKFKFNTDSFIQVVRVEDKLIAQVFMSSWIEI